MSPPKNYVWKPIEPWTVKWHKSYLPEAFAGFKKYLTEQDLRKLNERSAREWSIETGVIENAFELDRGVTTALIEQGFNASLIDHQRNGLTPEQVQAILVDTKEALDGLFEFVKTSEPLTTSYIRQLHQQLMRNVGTYQVQVVDPLTGQPRLERRALEPGRYKTQPNSPSRDDGSVHEYCPPEAVPIQMDQLVRIFNDYDRLTPPEVRAAWLHHAFAQIHPFQDGNGRVARALASLVLIKSGLPPLTVPREMRTRYLRSLGFADHERPGELLGFFESCLYRQVVGLWRGLRFHPRYEVSIESSIDEIIAAAGQRLATNRGLFPAEWGIANSSLVHLQAAAEHAMDSLSVSLNTTLVAINPEFRAEVIRHRFDGGASASISALEAWSKDVQFTARSLQAVGVTIQTDERAVLLVIFDSFSNVGTGICGAAVAIQMEGRLSPIEPSFFFNFADPNPEPRFIEWLNTALKLAILEWQKRIA